MSKYPNTIHFTALNRPVRLEASIRNLDVEGTIPAEIQGAFFRAVPDPAHPPLHEDDHALSGDGMVSRFLFENGHVDYDIKYVHTARYVAERNARWADWIAKRMDQPGTVFIAVGAGHLAGDHSVQTLLAKKHLTVTRIKY